MTSSTPVFVQERFELDAAVVQELRAQQPQFGFDGLGEMLFYRTYSRTKEDGSNESWADCVIRVINGTMSIAKDHYLRKAHRGWDEARWQEEAATMARTMFAMHWLPPGRGLWIMGTDYLFERGSLALFNCGFCDVRKTGAKLLSADAHWIMDALMCGVGIGFSAGDTGLRLRPLEGALRTYAIPDTREGWCESVRLLLEGYEKGLGPIEFDYSVIRPKGLPIRGFGGTSAGPRPLKQLHRRLHAFCRAFLANRKGVYTESRLVADCINAIGACVVAGNIRRSAEIAIGSVHDEQFNQLKNWRDMPERSSFMGLSNNSVRLETDADFVKLPSIAERIRLNGEPGFLNMINIRRYGRFGEELALDRATGCNPCGEIPLESYETCNLSEVFPTRCPDSAAFFTAVRCAATYATIVSWLPTHRPETNRVINRNRRIGVSLSGVTDWMEQEGLASIVRKMRDGYKLVRFVNSELAEAAGVRPAIRVTTIKPSGTISKLVGVSAGCHFPEFQHFVRRVRIAQDAPIRAVLDAAGVPHEPDVKFPDTTEVYEFPQKSDTRPVTEVSMWEQGMLMMAMQRHWADNMVSVTIKFDPDTEGAHLEQFLAQVAGQVKSLSMLPTWRTGTTAYAQMPEEAITPEEYDRRVQALGTFDWTAFTGDGQDERFCDSGACALV